jgi:hypothetical protein
LSTTKDDRAAFRKLGGRPGTLRQSRPRAVAAAWAVHVSTSFTNRKESTRLAESLAGSADSGSAGLRAESTSEEVVRYFCVSSSSREPGTLRQSRPRAVAAAWAVHVSTSFTNRKESTRLRGCERNRRVRRLSGTFAFLLLAAAAGGGARSILRGEMRHPVVGGGVGRSQPRRARVSRTS